MHRLFLVVTAMAVALASGPASAQTNSQKKVLEIAQKAAQDDQKKKAAPAGDAAGGASAPTDAAKKPGPAKPGGLFRGARKKEPK